MMGIKTEPIEEFSDIPTIRSLVLRFIRNKSDGTYSVVPLIKPDPFFEIHIKDEILSETEPERVQTVLEAQKTTKEQTRNNIKSKVKRRRRRVHKTDSFSCVFCKENEFSNRLNLENHILKHHKGIKAAMDVIKGPIFFCNFCKYQSLRRSNFRRHLVVHSKRIFNGPLPECDDNKRINKDLKFALSNYKSPLHCYHCCYKTLDRGSLVKHVRLHKSSVHMPFSCSACVKKFNEKNSLDSHIVNRHFDNQELLASITNKLHECNLCNYRDVNSHKMHRHVKVCHGKKARKARKVKKEVLLD